MWRAISIGLLWSRVAVAQGAMPVPADDDELPARPPSPEYLAAQKNYADASVTIDELPKLAAKWTQRKRVRFGGVVPMAVCGGGDLFVSFIGPVIGRQGTWERFQILAESEGGRGRNCFGPVSVEPGYRGPIHAAVRVRPSQNEPDSERVQVVVYNPPSRRDIVLVATKRVDDPVWTPLIRIDLTKATRIHFVTPTWH